MDGEVVNSLSRSICLKYLSTKLSETQGLLQKLRFCKCSEFGGRKCACASKGHETSKAASEQVRFAFDKVKILKDAGTQSDDTVGFRSRAQDSTDNTKTEFCVRTVHGIPASEAQSKRIVFGLAHQKSMVEQVYEGLTNPYVLIINNVNFWKFPRPRTGAKYDLDNLRKFSREAGFKTVVEHFDLPKQELLSILEITRQNGALVDHDGFICIIMSHGDEEGILGVDSKSIAVEDITAKFQGDKCPQLCTKPKLFFLQACRGDINDQGYLVPRGKGDKVFADSEETIKEMPVKLPSEADFLIAYSTTKGHTAFKRCTDSVAYGAQHSESLGSWFIACMVEILRANSHKEDLMTMLTKVNKAMTELYTGADPASGSKQISCQLSMLTKKVYFTNFINQSSDS